jgi:hypothetical protein
MLLQPTDEDIPQRRRAAMMEWTDASLSPFPSVS